MDGEKPLLTNTMTFLMLPNDLVLNCLARVSRLYYPSLSLVSKRFRSLLASLELYQTRTLLGCTESCLYVCLRFRGRGRSNRTRWFTLCRRPVASPIPNPNPRWFTPFFTFLENWIREEEDHLLISVRTRKSPILDDWWGFITLGYNIYKIGGCMSSSRVLFMDCRSNTWCEAPSMRVAREYPSLCVLDGKIYVAETNKDSSNWIEFFDPKTHIWEHVARPDTEMNGNNAYKCLAIEGKLYLFWDNGSHMVYMPRENRWDEVGNGSLEVPLAWVPSATCVIDNVLYSYRWSDKLKWYDFEERTWRAVKGLDKLYKFSKDIDYARLVDYGGKIAIMWEIEEDEDMMIWCAEILLERRNKHEIYGKVEWCDVVLTVPNTYCVMKLLAVTV